MFWHFILIPEKLLLPILLQSTAFDSDDSGQLFVLVHDCEVLRDRLDVQVLWHIVKRTFLIWAQLQRLHDS